MAWLCGRAVLQTCRRTISFNSVRCASDSSFQDPIEHATGLEKRELLAETAGKDDPYDFKILGREEMSTREKPNLVPSAFDSRIIGCVCDDDQSHINWMWLYEGPPRRCECGHWFKLVQKPPL